MKWANSDSQKNDLLAELATASPAGEPPPAVVGSTGSAGAPARLQAEAIRRSGGGGGSSSALSELLPAVLLPPTISGPSGTEAVAI